MPRTVIVGDLHACTGELEELLEQLAFVAGSDRLVQVGDLVVRGPDPHGALALVKRLGGRAVRGNHEDRLLAWRHRHEPLGPDHARVASALSDDEWGMLEALPMWLDLPEHGIRIVHAGVVPGQDVETTEPQALLKMRTLDARGRWSSDARRRRPVGHALRGPTARRLRAQRATRAPAAHVGDRASTRAASTEGDSRRWCSPRASPFRAATAWGLFSAASARRAATTAPREPRFECPLRADRLPEGARRARPLRAPRPRVRRGGRRSRGWGVAARTATSAGTGPCRSTSAARRP